MSEINDLDRLRAEYADRARRLDEAERYSYFNAGRLFELQARQRAVLRALKHSGVMSLAHRRILEVGCGAGHVLLEFLAYGAHPVNLYGVDLLLDRIVQADARLPHLSLGCADGQNLPFPDHAFDLVMQFTVFSSILDSSIKANIAAEMQRVVRPDGLILSYDFWLNPTNRQTRGIRPPEIRRLFPGATIEFQRITLAPPVARRLAPYSWLACYLLERLGLFNSHYLAAIRRNPPDTMAVECGGNLVQATF